MRVSDQVRCVDFPCLDTSREAYLIPDVDVDPEKVSVIMISEAAPEARDDHYYAGGDPLFARTTVQAFNDAGSNASSINDILELGVYLTTAVKCGKTTYAVAPYTVSVCSLILEQELALFPKTKTLLLMGDVAIRALNSIARRAGEPRVIPAVSTYKLRGQCFTFRGMRVFPSYLQAGPSFFIEKSKRRMISEDIAAALRFVG